MTFNYKGERKPHFKYSRQQGYKIADFIYVLMQLGLISEVTRRSANDSILDEMPLW